MCLDDQILNTYIDGELAEPWKSQVEEHIKHCNACRIRCENLKHLKEVIDNAVISDDEIKIRKDRVLSILEKNHINKQKKFSMFKKQIKLSLAQITGMAAAFVIVFVGSWTLVGSHSEQIIPVSNTVPAINIANITPTKSVKQEEKRSLDNYSLEEILQYLDAKGFNVDLSVKGIQPIEESVTTDDEIEIVR